MKKIILLFFALNTLLFSSNDFITSNGSLSFKYNLDYKKIINMNGNISTRSLDIDSIDIGIYYNGNYYSLSDYIIDVDFKPHTNIIKTIAKLPFVTVETSYIPSMTDESSMYIINEYDMIESKRSFEFIYSFNMSKENGVVEYRRNKDYYKYNDNVFFKNLKNSMSAYVIPVSNLEEAKLNKVTDSSIKYQDERLILASKMRVSDSENSDILRIKYDKEPNSLAFETAKNLIDKESKYWKGWLKPLPEKIKNNDTKEIAERFLIYLKTSINKENYYTNIGFRETQSQKAKLETAIIFMKYGYYDDSKKILEQMLKLETEFSYIKQTQLTIEEVKEAYAYLLYMHNAGDKEFYNKNARKVLKKIERIVKMIKDDQENLNPLELGYEFEVYYYTYNLLRIYEGTIGSLEYKDEEEKVKNYISKVFFTKGGIKKYRLDKFNSYSKWEYSLLYDSESQDMILDNLYKKGIFRRYPYLSRNKIVDVDSNLNILSGFYRNKVNRYGDINLIQLNKDIFDNNVKVPNKINLIGKKRYEINGIDIYLTSKYLEAIFDRSED